MTHSIPGPDWIPHFIDMLAETRKVGMAIDAIPVGKTAVYKQRLRNQAFADAWADVFRDAAVRDKAVRDEISPPPSPPPPPSTPPTMSPPASPPFSPCSEIVAFVAEGNIAWRAAFLENLAATSNVTASAKAVNKPVGLVYKIRRSEPEFAAKWRQALYEGYEHLELEVLAYLRGTLRGRKIDIVNAIRQLAAHRKTVAEMRLIEEEEDEQVVLDSINVVIEQMKLEYAASLTLDNCAG